MKIGDAENRWRGCRETNRSNNALINFYLQGVGPPPHLCVRGAWGWGGGLDFTHVVNEGGFS